MATFTVELRDVIESMGGDIGLNGYPIFDAKYRGPLNDKIVRRYYYQEIGFETPDMFRQRLDTRMREVMPYYNELYKTTLYDIDPLKTLDIGTVTASENGVETTSMSSSTSTSGTDSKSRSVASEFPQTMLSEQGDYATNAQDSTGTTSADGTASDEGSSEQQATGSSDTRQSGYTGNVGDILTAYRAALINIDSMICDELADLFMGTFNTDNSYTEKDWPHVFPYWSHGRYF